MGKDRIDKKEAEIKYCPTTLMLADYYTKSLQGDVFRRFQEVIMGYKHINDLLLDPDFLLKERVEKMNNIVIKKSGIKEKEKGKREKKKKNEQQLSYVEVARNASD